MQRTLDGEVHTFCCYGCCIAFQVTRGRSEESEAAWLLVRLGVGAFLSMNIMLFSLLLYDDTFAGADAYMLPWIHLLLWIFATPAVVILGGPFFRETVHDALDGRLTSSALSSPASGRPTFILPSQCLRAVLMSISTPLQWC
ncbi:hypothetical protein AJ87_44615 [Rhizobium yanglingense]|nr:hypothetical protein AJ87_44615 [Rhizobium yanglingense]